MSQVIRAIYKKAGFSPPDGKGLHTVAFHEMAVAIKKKNPGYSWSRCYSIAMSQIGRDKAVKKSHWDSTHGLLRKRKK